MKLRMQHNSIRLRLTRSEVAKLAAEGLISERVEFPNGCALRYELASEVDAARVSALFADGRVSVHAPQEMVREWAESERVGMEGMEGVTRISIEKDFQCLHGEKDPDAFEGMAGSVIQTKERGKPLAW